MKVYVIMLNDYPQGVHKTLEGAEKRIQEMSDHHDKQTRGCGIQPIVYFRVREFTLEN